MCNFKLGNQAENCKISRQTGSYSVQKRTSGIPVAKTGLKLLFNVPSP